MSVYLKFVLFLINFLCVLCSSSDENHWPDGYSYHNELNGWLKLHDQPVSWRAARTSCHMEGAFLASATTAEFVLSLQLQQLLEFNSEQSSQDDVPAIYTGFHTSSAEGVFTYINGKPALILYHDGLPAMEHCEAFFANGTAGEVSCDALLPYVCFGPASAPAPAPVTVSTVYPTAVSTKCPTCPTCLTWPTCPNCPTCPTCPTCPNCPTPVLKNCPTCPTPVVRTCPTPVPLTCPTVVPTTCPTCPNCPTPVHKTCPTCPTPAPSTCPTPVPTTCPTCPNCPTPVFKTCPTCPAPAPSTCTTPVPTTCPTCPTAVPTVCPLKRLREIGYELVEMTGHWYKFHTGALHWNDANRTCVEEGTHLAIINSKVEAQALQDLHKKYRNRIRDAYIEIWASIGIHKDSSGVWRTVDGRTLNQAGYDEWFTHHPLSDTSEGQLFIHGGLLSFDGYELPFICESENV